MKNIKLIVTIFLTLTLIHLPTQTLQAECSYVTDAGGYAYDECRAVTNLAPAIALGTVVVAAIVAIAVQNSHHVSGSSSSNHAGCSSSSGHFGSYYSDSYYY